MATLRRDASRYALAVIAAVAALAVRQLLNPLLGTENPYHTVWAAVVFAAWYCEVGPAVITTVIGSLGVWRWFLPPAVSVQDRTSQLTGLIAFWILSGFIIALGKANRQSQLKQRRAEEGLREKDSEFHSLADSIPELCWMAHAEGHIFWYNERWYEYTGTTPRQMEGWGWQSVHDPAILPSVMERWKDCLEKGQSFEMEFPLRGADGTLRWFLTRVRPLRNGEGRIVRWFGTNTNIHQQRELRQSLIDAREKLELRVQERTAELEVKAAELLQKAALLDLANDAIFVKSADGKITYWNRGAEKLYGWSRSQAEGRSAQELLRTTSPIPLGEIEKKDHWEGELRHLKQDGTQILVASSWTALRDKDGSAVSWLQTNTDITERKRAETAARKLSGKILTLQDEERRRIARGLHDSIGQYLAALKMNLELLSASDGAQAARFLECSQIVERCLTETRTISHLLHPPLLDEVGFASAAGWFVDGFAQRSGIEVNFSVPPQLGRFHSDVEVGLFRAVQEALTNVHRHSGASAVDIRLRREAQQLCLEITDNGRGIREERLNLLNEGVANVGVGVAGMRERLRELGGSVEIESGRTGTKVIVTVPYAETELEGTAAAR